MREVMLSRLRSFLPILILTLGAAPAAAGPVEEVLAGDALTRAGNPVLVRELLAGGTALGEEAAAAALEQAVRGLLATVETDPEEIRALEANREMRLIWRGNVAERSDAGEELASALADAGVALQRAGRDAEAQPVLELCVRTLAFVEVRSRCALALAEIDPRQALTLVENDVTALSFNTDSSLVVLGDLAAAESVPEALRSQAFDAIARFTGGFKRLASGEAAIEGLRRSGRPEAVPLLHKLSKGMMNAPLHTPARRALLVDFGDRSIVPLLEKKAKRGSFGDTEDTTQLESAQVLMEAGEPYGFEWARKELKGYDQDMWAPIVRTLAAVGTPEALDILRSTRVKPGKPKAVWVALGMLKLKDASRADEVRRAIAEDPDDWRFSIPEMAVALAEGAGDGSGAGILAELYAWASRQQRWSPGKIAFAVLTLDDDFVDQQKSAIDWLNWVKLDLIDALVAIGGAGAVPVLAEIVADREPLIGATAALGLTRLDVPGVVPVLVDALAIDFGDETRNRVLLSEIAVRARERFGAAAQPLLDALAAGDDPSLEVLAAAL